MKTGIMQKGLPHPAKLELSWDWFTGEGLTEGEELNLREEGWERWMLDPIESRELWIRPTPKQPQAEVPEVVAEEGGPDD